MRRPSTENPSVTATDPWRVLSYVPQALGAAALLLALWELAFPPFSDEAIVASVVDTWEASAFGSLVVVLLEGIALFVCLLFAWGARADGRTGGRRFMIAAALFLVAIACTAFSQHLLNARVERLTGQHLGWL